MQRAGEAVVPITVGRKHFRESEPVPGFTGYQFQAKHTWVKRRTRAESPALEL
jgi:hypothetical protein